MSIAEIERFIADLQSNAALKADAEKAQADKSGATPLARAVTFAASKGYAFTADEMKERAMAKAKASGKELTDAELDEVAGGRVPDITIPPSPHITIPPLPPPPPPPLPWWLT